MAEATAAAQLKQELAGQELLKPCCMLSELSALTGCCGSLSLLGRGRYRLQYQSHSVSVIKRIFSLLRQRLGLRPAPRFSLQPRFGGRRQFQLVLGAEDSRSLMRALGVQGPVQALTGVPRRVLRRNCCRRAWIRGMFLGCGSVQDIRKGYRAEFVPPDGGRADTLMRLLSQSGVKAGRLTRRGRDVLYIREGDSLATLLSLMGASRALLRMENVRAENSVREAVNRATNCDQANMTRQLAAAQQQIAKIVRISLSRGLTALPEELEKLARLRLANPDAGLKELAAMSQPPLTKSGVQHRLRRIMAFDEDGEDGQAERSAAR